jgi:hypothetical protein
MNACPQAVIPGIVATMPRRFTPAEICSFQEAVARGARVSDLARKHRFSPRTYYRWKQQYGSLVVYHEPTAEELRGAASWERERTPASAWRTYRAFASSDRRWENEADLPVFDMDEAVGEFESAYLQTRPDARVVLVCQKMSLLSAVQKWADPRRPSAAHVARAALAWVPPLASRWTCRLLQQHARLLKSPILFLGDLDPQALHAFAALRAGGREELRRGQGQQVPIRWVGLDSRWLAAVCKAYDVQEPPPSWLIKLRWLDREYWRLVQHLLPDARSILGSTACALLDGGAKIEVDAFIVADRSGILREILPRRIVAVSKR